MIFILGFYPLYFVFSGEAKKSLEEELQKIKAAKAVDDLQMKVRFNPYEMSIVI